MITERTIRQELITCFYNKENGLPCINYSSIGLEIEFNGDSIRLIFNHFRLGKMVLGVIDEAHHIRVTLLHIKLMNEQINNEVAQ